MVHIPNKNLPWLVLDLGVAFEAEVRVALDQQLAVNRTVRVVANRAPFTQRLVLKDEGTGLLAVALRAILVQPRHRQAARRLENVTPMRVVALHAIHAPLDDRMPLRQMKFRLGLQMALETGGRVLAWIDDKLTASAARFDVFAARTMTGLAAGLAGHFRVRNMDARMWAGREHARDIGMAVKASAVADVSSTRDFGRSHDGPLKAGAGDEKERRRQRQERCGE